MAGGDPRAARATADARRLRGRDGFARRAPPRKLRAKGVDLLVANDVAEAGSGFGTDTNRVTIYEPGLDPDPWPLLTKREVADRLVDRVAAALDLRDAAGSVDRAREPAPG